MKGFSPYTKTIAQEKTFTGSQKQPDDDSVSMTPKQKDEHRSKVLDYNKNKSKPMNDTQKRKIKEMLSKMDPNDPEAKLLQDMLDLPKNQ